MACVVSGCSSHSTKKKYRSGNQRFTFHRFPRDEYFKQLWIKAIGRIDWQPTTHSRICCKHFAEECYVQDTKRKWLRRSAIPTKFLKSNKKQKTCDEKMNLSECETKLGANNYNDPSTSNEPNKIPCDDLVQKLSSPDAETTAIIIEILCSSKNGRKTALEWKLLLLD